MANQYINAMSDLWNSSGTTYAAIKMNVTNAASAAASKLLHLQIGAVDKFTVDKAGAVIAASTITSAGMISSGGSLPSANDAAALGASGTAWSDLFLASGGVINWNAGDVTATHASDSLTFAGALDGYKFDYCIEPTVNDGATLGKTTKSWSDLYLATGAVVNYGAGNAILTHSDAVLTMTTGDFHITTAGTNSASAVTVGGVQTLTSKTLTSPTLTSPTMSSPTITSAPTAGNATWTSLGTVTTCDINGGTIDGTIIGATTPALITGTTITGTGGSFTALTGTVTTGTTGSFSTSVYGGKVQSGQVFEGTGTSTILAPAAGLNTIYFRPRGYADATGQVYIDNAGGIVTGGGVSSGAISCGAITSSSNLSIAGGYVVGAQPHLVLGNSSGAGTVYLRPNGYASGTGQAYVSSNGTLTVNGGVSAAGTVSAAQYFASSTVNVVLSGVGGGVYLRPNGPDSGTGQAIIDSAGNLTLASNINPSGHYNTNGNLGIYINSNYRCKNGLSGGFGGNWFNWMWDGVHNYSFIDTTNIGWVTVNSDYRIKKDVTPLGSMWDRIKALRPISYSRKAFDPPKSEAAVAVLEEIAKTTESKKAIGPLFKNDDAEQWGFIAHEMQEALLPTAATGHKDMEDGIQSLDWAPILAATVRALQEAMQRIEALEARHG